VSLTQHLPARDSIQPPLHPIIETSLRLLCSFEIGSDSDSRLGSNLGDAVLIYLKLVLKLEFALPTASDLEMD